jgi:hypothetical protein
MSALLNRPSSTAIHSSNLIGGQAFAFLAVVVTLVLKMAVHPLVRQQESPFLVFPAAIMLSACRSHSDGAQFHPELLVLLPGIQSECSDARGPLSD